MTDRNKEKKKKEPPYPRNLLLPLAFIFGFLTGALGGLLTWFVLNQWILYEVLAGASLPDFPREPDEKLCLGLRDLH